MSADPQFRSAKRIDMDRRMRWIETSLRTLGSVDVPTYRHAFNLSPQNATKDFARFSNGLARLHDKGVIDTVLRLTRGRLMAGEQEISRLPEYPVFGIMPLADWARMTIPGTFETIDAGVMAEPPPEIFSEVVKSIIAGSPASGGPGYRLRIGYFSASSGESVKDISPHSIVQAAGRHHVRAFDHSRNRGADFVLGRIIDAAPTVGTYYAAERDSEWIRQVELRLSVADFADPETRRAMQLAYDIPEAGHRVIRTRAALADYVMLAYGLRPPTYPDPAIRMEIGEDTRPFEL